VRGDGPFPQRAEEAESICPDILAIEPKHRLPGPHRPDRSARYIPFPRRLEFSPSTGEMGH